MKESIQLILIAVSIFVLALGGCSKSDSSIKEDFVLKSVMVSTSMIADVVANICGDKVGVESLIKAGQSPHNYEPGPRDIARLSSASLVFVNGFDLEEGLVDIITNNTSAEVVEVSQGIDPIGLAENHEDEESDQDDRDTHGHGEFDPHTWTSPLNVIKWCEVILKALENKDPDNSAYYQAQYSVYVQKLKALDTFIREVLVSIGHKPVLITDHPFMEYFARDYGVEIPMTISESFSSNSEPSPQDMARLIDYIKSHRIKAVFIGNTSDQSILKITKAIEGEMNYPLKIVTLLSGSLLPEGQEGDSYLSFMEYNVKAIVEALK